MGNAVETMAPPIVPGEVMSAMTGSCGSCHSVSKSNKKSRVIEYKSERAREVTAASAVMSARGAGVVCALDDGQVVAWICQMGTPFSCFSGYGRTDEVECMSIYEKSFENLMSQGSGDPLTFAGGTREGRISVWELDVMHGVIVPVQDWMAHKPPPSCGQTFSGVSAVAVDGSTVVSGGADSSAALWINKEGNDKRSKHLQRHMDGAHGGAVTAVCHSTIGGTKDFTMTAAEDGVVKAWSPNADCELPRHEKDKDSGGANIRSLGSSTGCVRGLVLDDTNFRCCAAYEDGLVRLWDLRANRATLRFGRPATKTAKACDRRGVQSVVFDGAAANMSTMTSGSADGSVCIWDMRAGTTRPVMCLTPFKRPVLSVAAHGDRVLAASLDGTARLWDIRACTGTCPEPLQTIQLQSRGANPEPIMTQRNAVGPLPDCPPDLPTEDFPVWPVPSYSPNGALLVEGAGKRGRSARAGATPPQAFGDSAAGDSGGERSLKVDM